MPFPFSVVPALGADFGVSAPGFYAAIPFGPPCSVHLIHLHKVPTARSAFGRGNSCLALAGKLPVVETSFSAIGTSTSAPSRPAACITAKGH